MGYINREAGPQQVGSELEMEGQEEVKMFQNIRICYIPTPHDEYNHHAQQTQTQKL